MWRRVIGEYHQPSLNETLADTCAWSSVLSENNHMLIILNNCNKDEHDLKNISVCLGRFCGSGAFFSALKHKRC